MATSSLDPANINQPDRQLGKGHGTGALGPSDLSDTGSDVTGGDGFAQQIDLGLDRGTTSDPEESTAGHTAGPDVGDANLDSDTDSAGTGERATAGRDTIVSAGQDIDADHFEQINGDIDIDPDQDDDTDSARHQPSPDRSKKNTEQR
ncbi:MAG: hypothetical protein JWQ21_83 [Herminiimonas sp.]|nr:hypothetical protein [Herminiimonas sp.]